MNEGAKTGIYWIAAVVMLAIALFVSRSPEPEKETIIGQPLFSAFSDPLTASSLRIVTFDEGQGEIATFEVAKDEQSGVWSLPSRNNYPADAAEQMKDAANALVGVKALDIQSENSEDHAKFGVLEPNVESLEAGDEGVGRLVTFKGQNNTTLASLIVGNPVKGSEGKRYVRVRGQDPVYVVNLDDKPLSTQFEDWIEKDLLQLSSIDISEVEIQNYDAALELGNQLSLERHYDAKLTIDGGNAWQLASMVQYDEQGEKKEVTLAEGEKLATSRLNTLKNALDDLKIVDVAAKPKGMSENLKADKDLVSDQQAVLSLAQRGFFPVTQGDILSANGEMIVTLKDGVQYVLRFGNVKGIDESKPAEDTPAKDTPAAPDKPADEPAVTGSNRYLLVTARVDESKFPAPDLAVIPKTVEELEAMEAAKAAAEATPTPAEEKMPAGDDKAATGDDKAATGDDKAATGEEKTPVPGDAPVEDKPEATDKDKDPAPTTDATPAENTDADSPESPPDSAQEASSSSDDAAAPAAADDDSAGTVEQSGAGEASGSGQGQDGPQAEDTEDLPAAADDQPAAATADDSAPAADDVPAAAKVEQSAATDTDTADSEAAGAAKPASDDAKPEAPKDQPKGDVSSDDAAKGDAAPPAPTATADDKVETPEEKQERLEAEQEKITKENQRKIDERKNKLEAAQRRMRELNGRFAEWYYVIPEATYRNLRLTREELIEKPAAASTLPNDEAATAPSFNLPPGLGQ